ncbi:MAG: class I SAM-dependent methyltransferase [Bacteroidales bacterium]|nr:class I SAM-dependent methyltransferase [Bacteroidales bacterium]
MMREEEYIKSFSTKATLAMKWIERETHLKTNHARMLSGELVGNFLALTAKSINAANVLEIGVFTGYSTIALSRGVSDNGHIDAIEINDELEEIIRKGYEMAGISNLVHLHIGDAKQIIPALNRQYDMVYIDANKREYPLYYNLVFDMVRSGGIIIADNVLWDGKVYAEPMPTDAQTVGIAEFNRMVAADSRVMNTILPIRDGLNVIVKL